MKTTFVDRVRVHAGRLLPLLFLAIPIVLAACGGSNSGGGSGY